MLIIREPQFKRIRTNRGRILSERLASHLESHFPEQCGALSEVELSEIIDYGKERARSYEFVSERDICKYLNLMFVFGRDFDQDPSFPWAGRLVNTKPRLPSVSKMEVLYEKALKAADSLEDPGLFRTPGP